VLESHPGRFQPLRILNISTARRLGYELTVTNFVSPKNDPRVNIRVENSPLATSRD
jgi:hypothetical protein